MVKSRFWRPSLATPRLSGFMLSFYLGPFYESQKLNAIAAAVYEEAAKWSDSTSRPILENKARRLRTP